MSYCAKFRFFSYRRKERLRTFLIELDSTTTSSSPISKIPYIEEAAVISDAILYTISCFFGVIRIEKAKGHSQIKFSLNIMKAKYVTEIVSKLITLIVYMYKLRIREQFLFCKFFFFFYKNPLYFSFQ